MVNPNIQLSIDLPVQSYPILIGQDLLHLEIIKPYITGRQILIVSNDTVAPIHLQRFDFLKRHYDCHSFCIPDGEQYKSCDYWFAIQDFLVSNQFHRDCTIIALGGGVIGDVTGFVASTFQRGVNLIQVPTTLLSQVDSSVGGKTAINHPQGKNLIGSFYHPSFVLIDINLLSTLPPQEFRSGFGEVIKYALLSEGDLIDEVSHYLYQYGANLSEDIVTIIAQCCRIKASYVNQDEKEAGVRALLNLGHTFAHAFETYTEYKALLHGEAVSIGLYCAVILSYLAGFCDKHLIQQVDLLLKMAELPRRLASDWSHEDIMRLMMLDKKVLNNQLRLILIKTPGDCFINNEIDASLIKKTLVMASKGVGNESDIKL